MPFARPTAVAAAIAGLAVILALFAGSPRLGRSATGDSLRLFTAAVSPCGSGTGTGVAFDGTQLYLSCWSSNVLERVSPADGSSLGPITITGTTDLGALSFDATRGKIWACSGGFDVLLIDLSALTATFQFSTAGCGPGLSHDPSDDTIWAGCNVCTAIHRYSTSGVDLGPAGGYDVTGKLGASGSTGIAAGGGSLYIANDGGMQIYACDKDVAACSLTATSASGVDDIECDDTTFAPKLAIWSQNAFSRDLTAWEVATGACSSAPTTATSTATATRTPTPASTDTPIATATPTRTASPTRTATSTATRTLTPAASATATNTALPTSTAAPRACLTFGQRLSLIIGIIKRLGAHQGTHRYKSRYDANWDRVIDVNDLIKVLSIPSCKHGRNR